jgi:hypothetical protein
MNLRSTVFNCGVVAALLLCAAPGRAALKGEVSDEQYTLRVRGSGRGVPFAPHFN